MTKVFIGLGSNLGDRGLFLGRALWALARLKRTRLLRWSSVYETEPVGIQEQPVFLNMAAEAETDLGAEAFLAELKRIERGLGRKERGRWEAREIDLDLLYFGTEVVSDAGLKLPHPELANRRFVLVPLREIAADFIDPLRQRSVQDLLHACPDTHAVRTTQFPIHPTE